MNPVILKYIYKLPFTLAIVNGTLFLIEEATNFNIFIESFMGFFLAISIVFSMVTYYKVSQRATALKVLLMLGVGIVAFMIFSLTFFFFSQVLVKFI